MKIVLARLLWAAAMTLAAFVLASSAHAQQADEDPSPATPRQQQSPSKPDIQKPAEDSTSDQKTQDALAFTGRVLKDAKGAFVLNDPVTRITYHLDDQPRVKPYVGKQVKVKGKLEMKSNTIHIDSVEPML